MLSLALSEIARYRNWAVTFALLYFFLLIYLYSQGITFTGGFIALWQHLSLLAAIMFGVTQMLLLRRQNHWVYLIQRPLSHQKIFLALFIAGVSLLLFTLMLPPVMTLIIMDGVGLNLIEYRHYLVLAFITFGMITAYGCACFAVLYNSRMAFLSLVLVTVFIDVRVGSLIFIPTVIAVAWACYLAYRAFKPDLASSFAKPVEIVAVALPIQYGLLWLIMLAVMFGYLGVGLVQDNHSALSAKPGSVQYVSQLSDRERMMFALEAYSGADVDVLRTAVEEADVFPAENPRVTQFPARHQLPFPGMDIALTDKANGVVWHFSHSEMLFRGSRKGSRGFVAWFGPNGFDRHLEAAVDATGRFQSVPWIYPMAADQLDGAALVVDTNSIYRIAFNREQIELRYSLPVDELFTDSLSIGNALSTIESTKTLYLFDNKQLLSADKLMASPIGVDITLAGQNLRKFSVAQLDEGYLVAMLMNLSPLNLVADYSMYQQPVLNLYKVTADKSELLSRSEFSPTFGDWYIYKDFIASPVIRFITDIIWNHRNQHHLEFDSPSVFHTDIPNKILLSALLLSMLSVAITLLLLRQSPMAAPSRYSWLCLNALSGVVGVVSFMLLTDWRQKSAER